MSDSHRPEEEYISSMEHLCEDELEPVEAALRFVWRALEACFRYDDQLAGSVLAADVYRVMLHSVRNLQDVRHRMLDTCGKLYDVISESEDIKKTGNRE